MRSRGSLLSGLLAAVVGGDAAAVGVLKPLLHEPDLVDCDEVRLRAPTLLQQPCQHTLAGASVSWWRRSRGSRPRPTDRRWRARSLREIRSVGVGHLCLEADTLADHIAAAAAVDLRPAPRPALIIATGGADPR